MAFRLVPTGISSRWVETPDSAPPEITRLPIPLMLMLEPPKLVAVKLMLGADICRSEGVMMPLSSSICPVNAVTAIGTS